MSIVLGPNPSFPEFKDHLQSVSTTLFGLKSIHPSPTVNAAFTALIVLYAFPSLSNRFSADPISR